MGQGCSSGHPLIYARSPLGISRRSRASLRSSMTAGEVEDPVVSSCPALCPMLIPAAFNHEFLNKLHVILGYLQTGQTQQAITSLQQRKPGIQPGYPSDRRLPPCPSA